MKYATPADQPATDQGAPGYVEAPPQTTQDTPPKPAAPAASSTTRRRVPQIPSGLYDRLGLTLALLGGLAIAGGLWWIGAYFTLQFLAHMGIVLAGAGLAAWLIPATITAGELWLWPRVRAGWQAAAIFAAILAFDVGSSWGGFADWGSGRHVPLFSGFTIPDGGGGLHVLSFVLGAIFAFVPEKIARWCAAELRKLWF